MSEVGTKSALICDNGLFVELAPRLARDFAEVKYFLPWTSAYPKAAAAYVGYGLKGVKRVESFWDHVPDADIVIFPDLYFADAQKVVAERFMKPIWGHRRAEALELDRWGMRKMQRDLKIAAPKTKFITGIDNLADYLESTENKWVKISTYRGDGETWHHQTWHTSRVYLDHFRNRVGKLADSYEFLVEDHLEGVEVGYDGWTVHGQYPEATFWGFEVKDSAYVGKFSPYADLPEPVRDINAKVAPLLEEERAVGFCSFEFRLGGDGIPYMIDPCMRAGSPPFEATQEAYDNLSEIIWEGAHGRMAKPRAYGDYIAMAMIHCPFALTNWVPIAVPDADRRWLKLRNCAVIDGELYHIPTHGEMPEIGAVVGVADSLEEAKALVAERAERIKGYNLDIHVGKLDSADEEIAEAAKYGIDF